MCDTLAVKRGGAVWFAKNSGREPTEDQRIEIHAPSREASPGKLRCTYIEIDQAPERRGVILSRPAWMWGAEMGVNDAGVAIGNEAVFSRSILKKGEALLGMDLVRLGLERAASAADAAGVMISLLERHGQGGGAGFRDRNFRYDNSFLIADAREIIVLETAGRDWAMKKAPAAWSISNAYTIGADYDRASAGAGKDFRAAHELFVMPRLACASARRRATFQLAQSAPAAMSLSSLAGMLRTHDAGDGFDGGSNRDVCLHASGAPRPHASTASMIVRLSDGAPRAAFTGTSIPAFRCSSRRRSAAATVRYLAKACSAMGSRRQGAQKAIPSGAARSGVRSPRLNRNCWPRLKRATSPSRMRRLPRGPRNGSAGGLRRRDANDAAALVKLQCQAGPAG